MKYEERLLTISEVVNLVGFKRSTIYKFISEGKFPKQVKFGKSSRWKQSEIYNWINKLTYQKNE